MEQKKFKRTWVKNSLDFFSLNISLCISFIFLITLAILTIVLNKFNFKEKEEFNIVMSVLNSFFGIFFAYCLGSFNYLKQDKINLIKQYTNYLENLKNDLIESNKKFKEEFLFTFQYIIIFIKFFNEKFRKKDLDLFFMEKWKLSNNHKNLNNIVKNYKFNLEMFETSIKELKNLNLNEEEINEIIELLIRYTLIHDIKKFKEILNRREEDIFKEIINDLHNFLFSFLNKGIEVLKINLNNFLKEVEERLNFCMNNIKECSNHRHYLRKRNKKVFCWSAIREIWTNIFSDEKNK